MDKLQALWDYQTAEAELEQLESSLKNTDTRKKLIRQQQVFQTNQQHLKQVEQESVVAGSKIAEIAKQAETLKGQMEEKDAEITEIADYDLEDMFLEDVQELVKECEAIKNSIEMSKRKLVDLTHKLEKAETDIKETLVKMSHAKKAFDTLKTEHEKELAAGKGDLDKLKAKVSKAAKSVDPALMEKYKEVKQHRPNPVARFKNRRCQGCNMELPSSVLQELRSGNKVITCENCGRILYLLEEE